MIQRIFFSRIGFFLTALGFCLVSHHVAKAGEDPVQSLVQKLVIELDLNTQICSFAMRSRQSRISWVRSNLNYSYWKSNPAVSNIRLFNEVYLVERAIRKTIESDEYVKLMDHVANRNPKNYSDWLTLRELSEKLISRIKIVLNQEMLDDSKTLTRRLERVVNGLLSYRFLKMWIGSGLSASNPNETQIAMTWSNRYLSDWKYFLHDPEYFLKSRAKRRPRNRQPELLTTAPPHQIGWIVGVVQSKPFQVILHANATQIVRIGRLWSKGTEEQGLIWEGEVSTRDEDIFLEEFLRLYSVSNAGEPAFADLERSFQSYLRKMEFLKRLEDFRAQNGAPGENSVSNHWIYQGIWKFYLEKASPTDRAALDRLFEMANHPKNFYFHSTTTEELHPKHWLKDFDTDNTSNARRFMEQVARVVDVVERVSQ